MCVKKQTEQLHANMARSGQICKQFMAGKSTYGAKCIHRRLSHRVFVDALDSIGAVAHHEFPA